MIKNNKYIAFLVILAILLGIYFLVKKIPTSNTEPDSEKIHFSCNNGSFDAYFTNENLKLVFSNGESVELAQTRSGSGIRYENEDTVFIGKGNDAQVQISDVTTYDNCVANSTPIASDIKGQSVFTDQGKTITFNFPDTLKVSGGEIGYTSSWRNNTNSLGIILAKVEILKEDQPKTNFSGAVFTIGTSSDPDEVKNCLVPRNGEKEKGSVTINNVDYKKITLTDAGAGNFYDTVSYRTIKNSQCYSIEHTIHSTNMGAYSPDQGIKEFDTQKIVTTLDSMVQSFKFLDNDSSVSNIKVTPLELVEDSRCPKDVQCIWAGTVKVSVQVTNKYGKNNKGTLTLGEKQDIGGIVVTLTEVAPEKTQEDIPFSKYKFTFVTK